MRKFNLSLAERILLRPLVINIERGGGLDVMRNAMDCMEAVDFTDDEQGVIDHHTTRPILACPQCGATIPFEGTGTIDLEALSFDSKEILLEDAPYEWLLARVTSFQGWRTPRKALFSMVEAIKGAEKVKPNE